MSKVDWEYKLMLGTLETRAINYEIMQHKVKKNPDSVAYQNAYDYAKDKYFNYLGEFIEKYPNKKGVASDEDWAEFEKNYERKRD